MTMRNKSGRRRRADGWPNVAAEYREMTYGAALDADELIAEVREKRKQAINELTSAKQYIVKNPDLARDMIDRVIALLGNGGGETALADAQRLQQSIARWMTEAAALRDESGEEGGDT
jgi:hypothetical protein